MFRAKSWLLLGLLGAACVVPDVEVGPSESDGGDSSSGPSTGGKGSSPSPNGGTGDVGEGGTPDGPHPGISGSSNRAGSGTGASPAGGKGNVPPDPEVTAFGKFCNNVYYGADSTTMALIIGTAPNPVTILADSDTCTPISGASCMLIPGGSSVPVEVTDGTYVLVSDSIAIDEDTYVLFLVTPSETIDGYDLLYTPVDRQTCETGLDAPGPAPAR